MTKRVQQSEAAELGPSGNRPSVRMVQWPTRIESACACVRTTILRGPVEGWCESINSNYLHVAFDTCFALDGRSGSGRWNWFRFRARGHSLGTDASPNATPSDGLCSSPLFHVRISSGIFFFEHFRAHFCSAFPHSIVFHSGWLRCHLLHSLVKLPAVLTDSEGHTTGNC